MVPWNTIHYSPKEGHWKFQGERSFLRPLNLNIQGKGCKTSDQKHVQWKGCEYFMKPCKWHKNLHYKYISAMLFYLYSQLSHMQTLLGNWKKCPLVELSAYDKNYSHKRTPRKNRMDPFMVELISRC